MSNEIPINMIGSYRNICDLLWTYDVFDSDKYTSSFSVPINTAGYSVFNIIMSVDDNRYYNLIVNDTSLINDHIVGQTSNAGGYYRSVRVTDDALLFGDIYYNGSVTAYKYCFPYRIYGIR